MLRYALRRLVVLVPVLWAMVTLVFFLVRLAPGGPFDSERPLSPQALERVQAYYKLDAPVWKQYLDYLGGVARGNLGPSLRSSYSVSERIASKLPVSAELGLYSLIFALVFGLAAGVFASTRPNSWRDHAAMSAAMTGICVPNIVLGPLLVLVFAIVLGWLPSSGWESWQSRLLPVVTLGTAYTAYIARLARGSMLEVLSQDFVRTARAKGLSESAVVVRHAMRAGLQPVVTFLGPATAGLLSGSFVVETVFDIPGLGTEFIASALNRDYTMVLGTVLVFGVLILILNLAADLIQAWLDPRVRY
ncbi:ABC transporter permease [bacterium]|nr:ABC transporter permease [bacterium]